MSSTLRDILSEVAAGRLDPQTAARMLDAEPGAAPTADTQPPAGAAGDASGGSAEPTSTAGTGVASSPPAVERLSVHVASYSVRLVADPDVATVVVDGPHSLHQEGSTLVLTGEPSGRLADGAYVMRNPGPTWRDLTTWFRAWDERVVRIRVRPDLPVDVDVSAGSLHSDGAALATARVAAGSAKVLGATHPLDLLVQAGSASVEARPTSGTWRLRTESGSLNLRLAPDSDVRLHAEVQLGKVAGLPSGRDLVLGSGAARADLEVVMGSAAVLVGGLEGPR